MMDNTLNTGGVSASKLVIKSLNVNGLGNYSKRQQIFKFLGKKGGDIQFLVDTRFSKQIESRVKEEWGSNVIFSSFTSQARGVSIFFKKNICVEILKQHEDNSGNIVSSSAFIMLSDRCLPSVCQL